MVGRGLAKSPPSKPTVPDSIQVPAVKNHSDGAQQTGFQIYVCLPDADGKP